MAIKSDKWIIEQAQENQLITPFSSEQIREVDGEKIVSYGVSSYGYVQMNLKYSLTVSYTHLTLPTTLVV